MTGSRVLRPRGFTLIETLIALALTSLLMGMIWSLLSLYSRLDQRGSEAAVEMQLVRSLRTQLEQDLQSLLIVDSSFHGQSSRLPNILSGSPTSLELLCIDNRPPWQAMVDVTVSDPTVAADPAMGLGTVKSFSAVSSPAGADTAPQNGISETSYRRVRYRFEPSPLLLASSAAGYGATATATSLPGPVAPGTAAPGTAQPGLARPATATSGTAAAGLLSVPDYGLVRESAPWPAVAAATDLAPTGELTVPAADLDGAVGGAPGTFSNQVYPWPAEQSGAEATATPLTAQTATGDPVPERQRDLAAEIARLEFRYLDANVWVDSWPGADGALPQAVEVRMDVDTSQQYREQLLMYQRLMAPGSTDSGLAPDLGGMSSEPEAVGVGLETDLAAEATTWIPEYRFVIFLGLQNDRGSSPGASTDGSSSGESWQGGVSNGQTVGQEQTP